MASSLFKPAPTVFETKLAEWLKIADEGLGEFLKQPDYPDSPQPNTVEREALDKAFIFSRVNSARAKMGQKPFAPMPEIEERAGVALHKISAAGSDKLMNWIHSGYREESSNVVRFLAQNNVMFSVDKTSAHHDGETAITFDNATDYLQGKAAANFAAAQKLLKENDIPFEQKSTGQEGVYQIAVAGGWAVRDKIASLLSSHVQAQR